MNPNLIPSSLRTSLNSYWSFDSSNANDFYSINNGTSTNVSYISGKFNNCASFNGSTAYIALSNGQQLAHTTFTISAWVYITTSGTWRTIITNWDQNNYSGWHLRVSNTNTIQFTYGNNVGGLHQTTTTQAITMNAWNHVAVTFVTSPTRTVKIFINGALADRTFPSVNLVYGTWRPGIGVNLNNGTSRVEYFNGRLDDIGYWTRALSDSEITDIYNFDGTSPIGTGAVVKGEVYALASEMTNYSLLGSATTETGFATLSADLSTQTLFRANCSASATCTAALTVQRLFAGNIVATSTAAAPTLIIAPSNLSNYLQGLISYYEFNNSVLDIFAERNGTSVGSISFSAADKKYGTNSVSFNGSSYITINNKTTLALSKFTISGWIKTTSAGSYTNIFQYWNQTGGTYNGFDFRKNHTNKLQLVVGNGSSYVTITGATSINTGNWVHVAATYESGVVRLYVNGVQDGLNIAAGTVNYNTSLCNAAFGATIGAGVTPLFYFNGLMDEFGIWNKVLTAAEIADLATNVYAGAQFSGSAITSATAASNELTSFNLLNGSTAGDSSNASADLMLTVKFVGSVSSNTTVSANLTTQKLFAGSVTASAVVSSAGLFSRSKYPDLFTGNLSSSLVSYWGLDNTILDSYSINNLTPSANFTYTGSNFGDAQGKFNGTNGLTWLTNVDKFQIPQFTWSGWVTGSGGVWNVTDYTNNYWGHAISVSSTNATLILYTGTAAGQTLGVSIPNTSRFYLTVTYNGTTAKIYRNGSLLGQADRNAPVYKSGSTSGHLGWANGPFSGSIDEVGFWNTALTDGDVSTLYSLYANTLIYASAIGSSAVNAELTVESFINPEQINANSIVEADLTTSIDMFADVFGITEVQDADLDTRYFVEAEGINCISTSEANLETQILFSGEIISYGEISSPELQSGETLKINDLVYETELIAYKLAKFVNGFNVNSQKITDLGNATNLTDAINYGQLTNISSSLKNYINVADADFLNSLQQTSGSIKDYVDASDILLDAAINNLSSSLVNYIDVADSVIDTATQQLSSSLKTYIDAREEILNQNLIDISSSLKTYVDTQDTVLVNSINNTSSSLLEYANDMITALSATLVSLSGAINNTLNSQSIKRVTDDEAFVKLDGSRILSGALNVGSNDIINANSATFGGDLTINGGLTVNGDYMAVNKIDISDKLITISKNALNSNAANGSGLFVDGANVSFTYDNQSGKWLSNIGLRVAAEAGFDAAIKLSGSTFTNITTIVTNNKFDLGSAIHDLDAALQQQTNRISNTYDSIRLIVVGQIVDGQAIINLTTVGGIQFATTEIDSISLDVLISEDAASYTDNFVSSKMYIDGNDIKVLISSPAVSNGSYRLIAINQKQTILLP